ncbi:MAG TPA: VWA domain-containing protein [Pyrinomonadaceae bacterium]|nr:VWA domain-containing protein [Pyrinomonadaceae bacterium]
MKRSFYLFLFLCVFAGAQVLLYAQGRPRRVGQPQQTSAPNPGVTQTPTQSPSRPPVLGGANRTPGSQTNGQPSATTPSGPEEVEAGDIIKVDTTLVTLPVSVMDRDGRYIPNLRKEDFRLWEEDVEQQVAFFSAVDKPFSLVLMIDTSGSTRFRLEDIQDAAITFVNQLRPDDRVMVVSFDDDIRLLSDFTNDRYRLRDAIRQTRTGNGTKLYDAVDMVINRRLNQISGRKAIVLFTDGVDTTSRYASYDSNIADAEELDALVYPIQYDTYADMAGGGQWPGGMPPVTIGDVLGQIFGGGARRRGGGGGMGRGNGRSRHEYEIANRYLIEMAERTGARNYQADSVQNMGLAFSKIAEELRRQYSLGYYPKNPAQPGQRRQVRIRVNQPNLAVKTRDSYVFKPSTNRPDDTAQKSAPVLRRDLGAPNNVPYRRQ